MVKEILFPLYEVLKKQVLTSPYLMIDETRLQVLDRTVKGKSHRGYLWAYYSPPQDLVLFDYRPWRDHSGPSELLKSFEGHLQTDGYGVYDTFAKLPGITALGCMAHARREFFESKDNNAPLAEYALAEIGKLYAIEREVKGMEVDQILRIRRQRAVPILQGLKSWMDIQYPKVLPSSKIGKALYYSMIRWDKLSNYTQAGHLQIDNNPVENSIRSIAIGRKNYLFAGSHEGAKWAAVLYSLMGSCKKNNIEPLGWLTNILTVVPRYPANRLHELLPNYKKEEN
jgi:transposase